MADFITHKFKSNNRQPEYYTKSDLVLLAADFITYPLEVMKTF
jgi:hypothetical protein